MEQQVSHFPVFPWQHPFLLPLRTAGSILDFYEPFNRTIQIMTESQYCVAGFFFSLSLPDGQDADRLLPSFRPFLCEKKPQEESIFQLTVLSEAGPEIETASTLLDRTLNDIGYTSLYAFSGGYQVSISPWPEGPQHILQTDREFTQATATILWTDPYAGHILSSMLRIIFSQAILNREAVSIHASAVYTDGMGYLFLGKSGTGKSTHAALWTSVLPNCELLNDDNPTLRLQNGQVLVYGTPWSGKTPCYKNRHFPVGGIVRLKQAPANRFHSHQDTEAFIDLLPGCSAIRQDSHLYGQLCDTLIQIATRVPVGMLECRPDREAAQLCHHEINRINQSY